MSGLSGKGRRRATARSLTVEALINQSGVGRRIPTRAQRETEEFIGELLSESAPPAPKLNAIDKTSRIAVVTSVATGLLLLTSVAAAAVWLTNTRPNAPASIQQRMPIAIGGGEALRPDLMTAKLGWASSKEADPVKPLGSDLNQGLPQPPAILPPDSPKTEVAPEVARGPQPAIDVVRRFFELLPTQPHAATRLLSTELAGNDPVAFALSWQDIKSVEVESATLRTDGRVLASVWLHEYSGRKMRMEQLFRLTDTITPRIVGVDLIAAQQA